MKTKDFVLLKCVASAKGDYGDAHRLFGSRKMAVELSINRKRPQRLMRILGIEAHYAKPNLSRPAPGHEIYPYLLRGVVIERPNHVWSTHITYIPMRGGFLYLVPVMVSRAEEPIVVVTGLE